MEDSTKGHASFAGALGTLACALVQIWCTTGEMSGAHGFQVDTDWQIRSPVPVCLGTEVIGRGGRM